MTQTLSTPPSRPSLALAVRYGVLSLALIAPCIADSATVPSTVHPNWTKIDLRPAGFEPQVSGMAFQSDGRLVIAHWNAARAQSSHVNQVAPRTFNGRIYLLSGVAGDTPDVTVDTLATGLEDLMGLTLVNDTIHVSGGNVIVRLIRAGGLSGPVTRRDTLFILPGTPSAGDSLNPNRGRQEYLYGLLHRDGKFYVAPSSLDPSEAGTMQINPYRGEYVEVTPGDGFANKRGSFRRMASGLRAPSGIGFGPDGLHCVSDNQGEWLPGNKLQCVKDGSHYGFEKPGANDYYAPFNAMTYSPPTVWVVQGDIGNSPTAPLYVPQGPYAGQILMGDVRWGTGINRYFLEKNAQGEWQGAVFVFTGGLEAGVFRMAWGPDGHLYAGMIGGRDDNDGYPKNQTSTTRVDYGLQKLRFNGGDPAFEMLAVRSRPTGFEIEFSKPVDTAVAKNVASYTVESYHMTPNSSYGGGSKLGSTTLTPSSILVAPDRRKVFLALSGLMPSTPTQMRVVYIRLNNYKSSTNDDPWATETWYTLNAFGTGNPFDLPAALASSPPLASRSDLRVTVRGGNLVLQAPFAGRYDIRLRDLRGNLLYKTEGRGTEEQVLPLGGIRAAFVVVEVRAKDKRFSRMLALP